MITTMRTGADRFSEFLQPFQYRFLWFNQTNKKGSTQNAQRGLNFLAKKSGHKRRFFGRTVDQSRQLSSQPSSATKSGIKDHQGLQTLFPVKNTSKQPELDSFETYILLLSTRLLASCAKHHLAILFCVILHSCRLPRNKWKKLGINRDIGIHWQSPQKRCLCSCRCSDKSGSLSMAPLYEKAEGNFQFGPLIKQRKFPDSTHEEGGNTTKAGAGNFCHSNSRIKHISGQWIFCYASAYAILIF